VTDRDQERQDNFTLYEKAATAFGLVDRVAEAVVQLVNSSGEHRIACHRGCGVCCVVFVRATHAEAAVIAAWLLAPERAARLQRFREQMAVWHAGMGPEAALLESLATKYDALPPPEPEGQVFREACRSYSRRKLLCPFNAADGSCEIYPIRPIACRAYYVADTSDHCGLDAAGEIAVVRHPKLIEIAGLARRTLREAAAAMGRDTVSALPAEVERAVAILESAPH
jgi:hypothetical protein